MKKREKSIALEFSKIGVIDYSCADEIVAKLISRLVSNEYGDKYIVLTGLNENQKENIEVALERKDLAVMVEMKDGKRFLLGVLIIICRRRLTLYLKKGKITANDLSAALKLPANTSGTRLLNLYKRDLLRGSKR